jgi:hypothetical protein
MSKEVRHSRDVIDDMHRNIRNYPSPEGCVKVGGDSVYTAYPQVQEFLEVLRLARVGLEFEEMVARASKNLPSEWKSV